MSALRPRTRGKKFFNRELSWIEFNRRVLSMAQRADLPLLERLKFLSIVSSNLDEFFMVRVASLKRQVQNGDYVICPSGMSPSRQLSEIRKQVRGLIDAQYRCLLKDLFPALADQGILFRSDSNFTTSQHAFLERYFEESVFSLLTPVRLNRSERNLNLSNLRLHVAFLLRPEEGIQYLLPEAEPEQVAVVQIPSSLDRVVFVPEEGEQIGLTFLEQVICRFAASLFPGYQILEHAVFRITRDADMGVDETRDEDFVTAMEAILNYRENGMAVRLNIGKTSKRIQNILKEMLGLDDNDVYEIEQPLDPSIFFSISGIKNYDHLRFESWKPVESMDFPQDTSMFEQIARKDLLLCTPYESFSPVVRLVQEAALDPDVLSIKMTLYRTSGDSPIVAALEQAARNGKHVTALVEIKARFDEARNIGWAERLSRAGVIVVYGLARLKVHAKAMLVIRREDAGMKRYLHLSTGNYNDRTARLYSDMSLFTCREELCYETSLFFNAITGYSAIPVLKNLVMAPTQLKPRLIQLIEREAHRSTPETPGCIIAKLNALADVDIIEALYQASRAGVKINLNIRGICMLVPGVPGMSENIRVTAIIDRYLEHSRLVWFQNGGQDELYCASADWMPRNLEGRVELMFPVEDEQLKDRVKGALDIYLADNRQSFELMVDGSWIPTEAHDDQVPVQAQAMLYQRAVERSRQEAGSDKKEFRVRRKPPKE